MGIKSEQITDGTRAAGADLTDHQFGWVKLNSDGAVVKVNDAGDRPYGILQNDPKEGQAASVVLDGVTQVKGGESIDADDLIGPDADGFAETKTAGTTTAEFYAGVALTDGGDGTVFTARVTFPVYLPA